jgi:hypothetical protein
LLYLEAIDKDNDKIIAKIDWEASFYLFILYEKILINDF